MSQDSGDKDRCGFVLDWGVNTWERLGMMIIGCRTILISGNRKLSIG